MMGSSNRVYINRPDIETVLTMFEHRITEKRESGEADIFEWFGGYSMLLMLAYQDRIDTPQTFVDLFERQVREARGE